MKILRFFSVFISVILVLVSVSCDFSGDELGENEVKVKASASSLVGTQYEDVVEQLEGWGFTNIETEVVYDIIFGITKEGTTKSVKIGGSENFSSGDIYDKDVLILVTYSMKASNDPIKQKYTITWQYEDGTVIKTENVLWGNIPNYTGDTPVKNSTNEFKYTFSGWTPKLEAVTGKKTYVAVFTIIQKDLNKVDVVNSESYFIGKNFEDVVEMLQEWGFTNIKSVPVYDIVWDITEPGSTKDVTINGSDKFKNGDVYDKEVLVIVTYSMRDDDDPTKQKYTITWQYENGVIIRVDQVLWGLIPTYKGNTPTKNSTIEVRYTFKGWSPEIVEVTGDMTYIAQFIEEDVIYQISYLIPDPVVQIISGGVHGLAITTNGQVYSWGFNMYGQLGDGTKVDRRTPVNITKKLILNTGEFVTKIAAGSHHNLALTSFGRVFSWGKNDGGILGDGTTVDKLTPVDITEFFYLNANERVVNVFAGERGDHSLATTSSGRIFAWGSNEHGQLGDGTNGNKLIPVNITRYFGMQIGETIVFSLGDNHTLGLTSTGRVFSWGRNNVGQLGHGTGTTTDELIPIMINVVFGLYANEKIIAVEASLSHSQAISSRGRVFSWGIGMSGQHGDGSYTDKLVPTNVTSYFNMLTGEVLTNVYSVGSHSFAKTSDNRIFSWGHNYFGQCGDGTTVSKAIPIDITNKFNLEEDEAMIQIVGGFYHSYALTSKGRVFSWGANSAGQMGDGTSESKSLPIEINSGFKNSIILKTDSYHYGDLITMYVPIREGYKFEGWYTTDTFTTLYIFNNMPAQNISLYGKWSFEQ